MLRNACLLAKIGADTVENERNVAKKNCQRVVLRAVLLLRRDPRRVVVLPDDVARRGAVGLPVADRVAGDLGESPH